MAIDSSTKFGIVYTTPSDFVSKIGSQTNTDGKLYVLHGSANGGITQGIYMVESNSSDPDGSTNVQMLSSGALASANNAGLMSTSLFNKLDSLDLSKYLPAAQYVQVSSTKYGYVPKANAYAGTINNQTDAWVLTSNNSSIGWYKLPLNAFSNTTYTGSGAISLSGTTFSHTNSGVAAGYYGEEGSNRTLAFGETFKVVDTSVNSYGHITAISTKKLTLPIKPATAGTADIANQVANSLKVQGDGTDIISFNGSTAKTINIVGGTNVSLTKDATNGKITINADIPGALVYQGVVATLAEINAKSCTTNNKGDVYVASANFSGTITKNNLSYTIEKGDMFICNGSSWDIVNGEGQVTNGTATLEYAKSATIATIDGVDITLTGPATPVTSLGGKTGAITLGTATSSNDKSVNFSIDGSNKISASVPSLSNYLKSSDASSTYLSKTDASTTYLKISNANYFNTIKIGDASIIADSSKDILTIVAGDNITLTPDVTNDTITIVATDTVYSHPVAGTGSIDTPSATSTPTTLLTRVKIDSSGHVTDTSTFTGTVGGTTTPIYFKAGVPTALSYTIAKSVPSDAVFSDTKVTDASSTNKAFILGHATQGTTTTALTNASCYMSGGYLYSGNAIVATQAQVQTAQEAATVYWETL